MIAQDFPLEAPIASEVTAAVIELAGLARQAGSATTEALNNIASALLRRLLVLCAAQRGAIFLSMQEHSDAQQCSMHSSSGDRDIRTLAIHGLHEEEAYATLSTFPLVDVDAGGRHGLTKPDIACWMIHRLPLGEFMASSGGLSCSGQEDLTILDEQDELLTRSKQPLQALIVLGWKGLEDHTFVSLAERSRTLLPLVANASSAVIVSILMAERIHKLEAVATRETIRQMELLKVELLASVSHEMRSPLASIKGYAATLLRHERRLSREERRSFLLAINEGSDRLEIIIERLLEMSQMDSGAITLQRSPVDVARLAQEAITAKQGLVALVAERFLFRLHMESIDGTPADSVPLIEADPRRLRELLDNLLENAIKYSPEGGTITVTVRPIKQSLLSASSDENDADSQSPLYPDLYTCMLEICVKDSGIGIPTEHLERVFEPFHCVDMRLIREVNGLGLGLAICKRIVELHNGVIWAESSSGKGSAFHVLLPMP
jgi:signal transduction histidine kinase